MKTLRAALDYRWNSHYWRICAELKITNRDITRGLMGGPSIIWQVIKPSDIMDVATLEPALFTRGLNILTDTVHRWKILNKEDRITWSHKAQEKGKLLTEYFRENCVPSSGYANMGNDCLFSKDVSEDEWLEEATAIRDIDDSCGWKIGNFLDSVYAYRHNKHPNTEELCCEKFLDTPFIKLVLNALGVNAEFASECWAVHNYFGKKRIPEISFMRHLGAYREALRLKHEFDCDYALKLCRKFDRENVDVSFYGKNHYIINRSH